jgi:ATP synthase protein I
MADGARDENRSKAADEAALSARLKRLGEGLDRTGVSRPKELPAGARESSDRSAMARGLRLSAELVGGVIAGAGIGWILDYAAGTSPWGFIVFLMLGFAGGVFSVMRSAGVLPERKL